jgi:hypothetical protein
VSSLLALAGIAHLAASCSGAPAGADHPSPPAMATLGWTDPDCRAGEARPTTGAPAEGLWLYEDESAEYRVAAIVGPPQSVAGRSQVTRRVETLQARAGADTIRHASDSAAVRLQLVPPFARPAAAYAVGPVVLLAAYEPCPPGFREPLIRYLRRDQAGHVQSDVMLQRSAAAP